MIWAVHAGKRMQASPGLSAACPGCGGDVIPKCGTIVSWHWAHVANECDPWHEPESQWHRDWKGRFPKDWQEIRVDEGYLDSDFHVADVKTPTTVIEFQSSGISADEIHERERFYGNMVWMLKGSDFFDHLSLRDQGQYINFRWKWPRKSWFSARKPIFIDVLGLEEIHGILEVKKLFPKVPCGGWARLITEGQFLNRFDILSLATA